MALKSVTAFHRVIFKETQNAMLYIEPIQFARQLIND